MLLFACEEPHTIALVYMEEKMHIQLDALSGHSGGRGKRKEIHLEGRDAGNKHVLENGTMEDREHDQTELDGKERFFCFVFLLCINATDLTDICILTEAMVSMHAFPLFDRPSFEGAAAQCIWCVCVCVSPSDFIFTPTL